LLRIDLHRAGFVANAFDLIDTSGFRKSAACGFISDKFGHDALRDAIRDLMANS
jgi:hypothetical protein